MSDPDRQFMARALVLARQGEGSVEPNPMVGCVVVQGGQIIGEGWHRRFGGPHAEVEALGAAGPRAAGSTLYVTLEPCCHHGKTPPCTRAVIDAGVRRVVIAIRDPFPEVDGGGVRQLEVAGIEVALGVMEAEARELLAPYLKLVETGRPWTIAKWAMSLDGKIATRTGESRWISGEASRAVVHELRGRMDAIVIGRRTAERDDPLLTARPPGPRVPTRIVLDTNASLSSKSQLVQTAADAPVLVAVAEEAPQESCIRLVNAGCEVFHVPGATREARLFALWGELGRRRMTNVLVEGGAELLGSMFDAHQIDELHVFIAPKLIGGNSPTPLAGKGIDQLARAGQLRHVHVEQRGEDIHITGWIAL